MSDDSHIIEAELEAWKQYKMTYDCTAEDEVRYFDESCETQHVVPGTHEFWECSCGATFTSGFEAADHLREMSKSTDATA